MSPAQHRALLAALAKNRGELNPAALQRLLAKLRQA
jgi:hypothetical protein